MSTTENERRRRSGDSGDSSDSSSSSIQEDPLERLKRIMGEFDSDDNDDGSDQGKNQNPNHDQDHDSFYDSVSLSLSDMSSVEDLDEETIKALKEKDMEAQKRLRQQPQQQSQKPQKPQGKLTPQREEDKNSNHTKQHHTNNKKVIAASSPMSPSPIRPKFSTPPEPAISKRSAKQDQQQKKNEPVQQEHQEDEETKDEETIQKELVAQVIAQRLKEIEQEQGHQEDDASLQSMPRCPLERIRELMEKEKEQQDNQTNKSNTNTKNGKQQTNKISKKKDGDELDEDEKELVQRIVEMRIAELEGQTKIRNGDDDDEKEDGTSIQSNPEDPLVRIMSMKAEDTLMTTAALMQFDGYNHHSSMIDESENSEEDGDAMGGVVRNRDIYDLNNMIYNNNLEDLERTAALLAQNVKIKLGSDGETDLTEDILRTPNNFLLSSSKDQQMGTQKFNGVVTSQETVEDIGYHALVQDAVNRSIDMTNKSTSTNQDSSEKKGNQNSSSRITKTKNNQHHRGTLSTPQTIDLSDQESLSTSTSVAAASLPTSPRKKLISNQVDVVLSDWWGVVGDFASVRGIGGGGTGGLSSSSGMSATSASGTWESDSQSSISYATAHAEEDSTLMLGGFGAGDNSVTSFSSSMEGYSRVVRELDRPIGEIDWDGIHAAIQKQQDTAVSPIATTASGSTTTLLGLATTLEEKRQKKREIEARKLAIVQKGERREADLWAKSLVKSGL